MQVDSGEQQQEVQTPDMQQVVPPPSPAQLTMPMTEPGA